MRHETDRDELKTFLTENSHVYLSARCKSIRDFRWNHKFSYIRKFKNRLQVLSGMSEVMCPTYVTYVKEKE